MSGRLVLLSAAVIVALSPVPALAVMWVTLTTTESAAIVAGAAGVQILGANPNRKFLRVTNDGTGNCRIGYGGAPTATTGEPIAAAAAAGQQGGAITFEDQAITQQSIWAYCSAASTFAIVEGQ